jgi:protein-arginine kinase activator protein McsA
MAEASFVSEGGEEEKAAAPSAKPEQEEPPNPQLSQLEQLTKRLDDAIAKEDYEKAAQLRDELKKLQGRNS